MNKSRLEAFSDGVLAIIITIMVLELRTPAHEGWRDLLALWPTLAGYAVSFIYVGVYWNNHHHLLQTVRRIDGRVMWANLHLLFWLSLFPFVTGWVDESHLAAVPMTCYAAVALMAAVAYAILARSIIRADQGNQLLIKAMADDTKGTLSLIGCAVALVAPFFGQVGTALSAILITAVALMWLLPDRRIERLLNQPPDAQQDAP